MVVVLAKHQFIDALPDEDTRLRIRQSRPTNLRQALETAMELESYAIASKKAKQVREVRLVKRGSGKEVERVPQSEEVDGDLLKQFEACIERDVPLPEIRLHLMLPRKEVSAGAVGYLVTSNATVLPRRLPIPQQPVGMILPSPL